MNEDIESLLRRMPLQKPPADLDRKVLRARPRRFPMWVAGVGATALAAAAALVMAVYLPQTGVTPPVPGPTTPTTVIAGPAVVSVPSVTAAEAEPQPDTPMQFRQNWSPLAYEGIVEPDDHTPLRKYRRQTYDYVRWSDPRQGFQVETTIPREEVILIKADVH